MALIPLNQTVILHKSSAELDEWGNPVAQAPITLQARVDEGSFVTSDTESALTGKVIVASVRVLLEGLANISYDDEIEFKNELNIIVKRKPKRLTIRRNVAGSPELTEVLL